jgi:hypothetical protein
MAKRYTATVQLRCWKQHTCVSCECVYTYVLDRKVSATAGSQAGAQANLQKNFTRAQREECDMQPCPNCGQYQPDMIGSRLARKRKIFAGLAIIMPILILILRATYAVQANTLTWVAFIYCIGYFLLEFFVGAGNPNSNREANRDLAANRIAAGALHTQPMTTTPDPNSPALPVPTRSLGHIVAMGLLAGMILLSVCPELIRGINRWPLNAECYPPVVGPGDTTRVYLADSISSIKGYWRGVPQVACKPVDGGQPVKIQATTNQNDWGSQIEAKSDEERNSSHPWVELQFPNDSDLTGKKVTCHIDLDVEYPEMHGASNFVVQQATFGRDVDIEMGPSAAGSSYNSIWWSSTVISLLGVFVAAVGLFFVARNFQRKAKPTRVMPLQKT